MQEWSVIVPAVEVKAMCFSNSKRNKIFLLTTTTVGGKGQQTSVWGLCPFLDMLASLEFKLSLSVSNLPFSKYSVNQVIHVIQVIQVIQAIQVMKR